MFYEYWDMDVGCCEVNVGVEDFLCFYYYFLFFFGWFVVYESIDMWDNVKCNLFGEWIFFNGIVYVDFLCLCL